MLVNIDVPEGLTLIGQQQTCSSPDLRKYRFEFEFAPAFKWPDWIAAGYWIAMDPDGSWWLYSEKPLRCPNCWFMDVADELPAISLSRDPRIVFAPPAISDWKSSLMQKPA